LTFMKIGVLAYGSIQKHFKKKGRIELDLEDGSTVADLFRKLKKPKGEVWMFTVNGFIVSEDETLKDGDLVRVFEPVGGG